MRIPVILAFVLVALVGCGGDGKPNDALVGKWNASEVYGGDTWQLNSDGTFTIGGGQRKSLDGSDKMVPNLQRSGKWVEKDGTLSLKYDGKTDMDEYRWKKSGGELHLTRAGKDAPEMILRTE